MKMKHLGQVIDDKLWYHPDFVVDVVDDENGGEVLDFVLDTELSSLSSSPLLRYLIYNE